MHRKSSTLTRSTCALLLATAIGFPAHAAITATGIYSPANPSSWTVQTVVNIGTVATGTVTVDGGSTLLSNIAWLGWNLGAHGTVSVDGLGSSWRISNSLYLGNVGSGSLAISDGGTVSVTAAVYAASLYNTSSGSINFGSGGGTLAAGSLYASPFQTTGTGTINVKGLVTDGLLNFDAAHGLTRTIQWNDPGQNTSLNLDLTGTPGDLGVGYSSAGTLTITDAVAVKAQSGFLGYRPGSSGFATVDGLGSNWNLSGSLTIGYAGTGSLQISNGAKVSSGYGYLASNSPNSFATVTVSGPGSTWTNNSLYIGSSGTTSIPSGNGALLITDGGSVISGGGTLAGSVSATGMVTVSGPGSTWSVASGPLSVGYAGSGTLTIANGGKVTSGSGYLGYLGGSTGAITVDGAGSSWTLSGPSGTPFNLYIGNLGVGSLAITNGGLVSVQYATYLAYNAGSSGTIQFGASGGTLTTRSLYAAPSQTSGTGTINTGGLVIDGSLVFDATHGASQSLVWKSSGQNVTVNVNISSGFGDVGAGYTGAGSLVIKDGAAITSEFGYVGCQPGSTGNAVISGNGSTWNISTALEAGFSGNGSLTIASGGKLTSLFQFIGHNATGTGIVTVDGAGSAWNMPNDTLNLGYSGNGTLAISNGGSVTSGAYRYTYLGHDSGSAGNVIVSGSGSTWSLVEAIYVGYSGRGSISITNAGKVTISNNMPSYLGYNTGSSGMATVDGPGSTLSFGNTLYIGNSGTGSVVVSNGGKVSTQSLVIKTTSSLLTITVGDSSLLTVGFGSLTNSGTIRLKAAPSAQPNSAYTPIIAGSWSGSGTIQPLGGTWNTANHTFTPSTIATGTASQPLPIDRSQQQRLQLTNPQTNSTFIANVAPTTTSSTLTLTANPLTNTQAITLQATLAPNAPIFAAWTFATTGYTNGDPVYLSLSVPSNLSAKTLSLYHFNGTTWSLSTPLDFSYDGTYASFTTTDLNGFLGYAITGTATLPGDATLDNKVDAFDLNALAAHWQNPTGSLWQSGDFNADGIVDAFDLNTLAAHWQSGTSLEAALFSEFSNFKSEIPLSPIPEPSTLSLLPITATLGLIPRRRRLTQVV